MDNKPVLYAEDSEDDVFLLRRAFEKAGVPNPLTIVPNGKAVVQYLSGTGPYADRQQHPFPKLVLLDIKIPHRTGLDVLCWIRQQAEFRDLPVFILTSSNHERDIASAYSQGANGYVVKPASASALTELGEDLKAVCTMPEPATQWLNLRSNQLAAGKPA